MRFAHARDLGHLRSGRSRDLSHFTGGHNLADDAGVNPFHAHSGETPVTAPVNACYKHTIEYARLLSIGESMTRSTVAACDFRTSDGIHYDVKPIDALAQDLLRFAQENRDGIVSSA